MHLLLILILLALVFPGFVRGVFQIIAIIILLAILMTWFSPPSRAETVWCSITSQGYRVCSGNEGYQSFETQSQGYTAELVRWPLADCLDTHWRAKQVQQNPPITPIYGAPRPA